MVLLEHGIELYVHRGAIRGVLFLIEVWCSCFVDSQSYSESISNIINL